MHIISETCFIRKSDNITPACTPCQGTYQQYDNFLWTHLLSDTYRVSIKSFPDYKHLLQENYVEYKHIFLPLLVCVVKKLLELSYILKKEKKKFLYSTVFL